LGIEGSGFGDLDPYKIMKDPGGPKTYGSGSTTTTVVTEYLYYLLNTIYFFFFLSLNLTFLSLPSSEILFCSVADPGCLSQILDSNFYSPQILDPGSILPFIVAKNITKF
jgi:hypothetical protein